MKVLTHQCSRLQKGGKEAQVSVSEESLCLPMWHLPLSCARAVITCHTLLTRTSEN